MATNRSRSKGGMNYSKSASTMRAEEKRVAELERVAASAATIRSIVQQQQLQHQMLQQGLPMSAEASRSHTALGSRQSATISGSEADFLVRQISTAATHTGTAGSTTSDAVADISAQLSMFSNLDGFESLGTADGLSEMGLGATSLIASRPAKKGGKSVSAKDIIAEAFRERVANLERQLITATHNLDKCERDVEARDAKIKRLSLDLEVVRKEAMNDISRLQSEHEVEILRIREQHTRDKAIYMAANANAGSAAAFNSNSSNSASNANSPTTKGPNAGSSNLSAANSKLIEQLEQLRLEQRRMQDTFADERRSAQIDFSNKMLAQERKLKAEIMELKSNTAVLEDKVLSKNEEYNHALIQIEHMKHLHLQLEMNKKEAIEGQNKLRADLKIMQQSVQASYRLDASQQQHPQGSSGAAVGTSNVGVDAETTIRLNDAKNEAKSRQLMNKVEFLKAQLDAEKKANEDLKQSMEATRQKLEEVRDEFKYRMQECERIKHQAVEEAEQRVEYQYEERMKELTALQTKVMLLQGQYTEMYQENLNTKQQEERAKMISNKQLAITATLKTEVEQQRALIEQLRNDKETETLKENSKQNNDAIIRRLDNERQYLKSQLTSEMTHKNELQLALTKCTTQNQEIQKQWSDDVMTLKDSLHQEQQKFKDRIAHYKQVESSLTTELNTTKSQLKELKDGFMKQRDGLRMEQLTNENTVGANRRLAEQLELANADIAQLRANDSLTAQQFKSQIEAINSSIAQQEAAHAEEITKLKEELADQYALNANHQTHALAMIDRQKKDHLKMVKLVHTTKLAKTFNKWILAKIYRAFRLWKTNSTLVAVAVQIRGQVEELLKKNTDDLHAEQKKALEVQLKKLNKEHHIQTQLLKHDHEQTLQATLQKCQEEKEDALQALTEEHNAAVQQLEADFNFDLMSTKKGYEEKIYTMDKKNELDREMLIQKHKDASEAASELSRHRIALAKEQKEVEMNELWTEKLKGFDAEQTAAHERAIQHLKNEHASHVAAIQKDHKDKVLILKAEHEEHVRQTVEQLEAKHAQHVVELGLAHDNKMREFEIQIREEEHKNQQKMRADLHEANEARIRELRELWQQEWDELMVEKTKEFEERLNEKMEEYAKSVEADKLKAVKLEGSKWKQAIKEMEQTNELTIMKARAETAHQKDGEFKMEVERMNNKFEAQKMKDFQLHAQMMSDLKHEGARALEKQKNKFELQCEELRLEVTESITLALEEKWEEKMKQMQKEAEQRWSRAVETEKENGAKLLRELTTTQDQLATEKNNLQRTIRSCDDRVAQMEILNKSDMQMLKDEFENERDDLRNKGFEDLRLQRITFDEEKVQLGIEIEGKYKFITESQVGLERQRLTDEYEGKITDLCVERDRTYGDLNKTIAGLTKNKDDLTLELSNVQNKLEDTEDALYDSQQECKKIQKEQSLVVWKSATNMMQMKIRFQAGIKQFDMEANKRYDQIKREMQNKLNDVTLLMWQLTVLLNEVETNRVRTFSTLTNYRVDEISKKKQQIQKMERELEQITMEKDSLEEQKELMERDVQLLEDQVRELEDQIREHNRESSMVNGRINVAHARKKRRLDSELERMLETIEQKRMNQTVVEQKTAEKARERDEKELEMIDLEKMLVGILVEQQKQIMSHVDEGKTVEERCKALAVIGRIPYPINYAPAIEDVVKLMKQRDKEDEMYA